MTEGDFQKLEILVNDFSTTAREQLSARWNAWKLDLDHRAEHEVLGALLARQVTLAEQLAAAPSTWNEHIAPIVLRSMAEVHITLVWIVHDRAIRAAKFIDYGLGQKKLELEHRRAQLGQDPDPEQIQAIEQTESWLNAQRFTFLQSVNLGSWSGLSVRKMAEEADCFGFYDLVYSPFSSCVHSMWYHIATFNLRRCADPLHQHHQVPSAGAASINPHYFWLAAKYVQKTLSAFDEAIGVKVDAVDLSELVYNELGNIFSQSEQDEDPDAV